MSIDIDLCQLLGLGALQYLFVAITLEGMDNHWKQDIEGGEGNDSYDRD